MGAVIKATEPGSIAEELGLCPGDFVVKINGENFTDRLEYGFLIADSEIELLIKKENGEEIIFELEKDEYEDLGIVFESSLIDAPRSCRNKCIFCFIDQLPKGLRKPLYFKDDDTRLSFLTGNYVTLTNIDEKELFKIIRLRLSPINVSVHTTDDELRKFMLKNKNAVGIKDKLKILCDGNITLNCQIVLVKGVNDGKNLDKTLNDLSEFFPGIYSISVVPVGISDHREGLYPLEEFTKEDSEKVIAQLEAFQNKFLEKFGSRKVYIADEFYLKAGIPIPDYEVYEDFPQIENGVGMISEFMNNISEALKCGEYKDKKTVKTIVTGKCAYPYIKKAVNMVENNFKNVKINIVAAENKLFGKKITVAGLLCGKDILDSLEGTDIGDALIVPDDSLRAEKDMFLDSMTKEEFEEKAGVPVYYSLSDGTNFLDILLR